MTTLKALEGELCLLIPKLKKNEINYYADRIGKVGFTSRNSIKLFDND
ncbi:MAG: hypothetical protein LBC61_00320 [Candidatus Peribacteria bacterium]|nr:hypothetical protein [Candidatus Peribacteria bacterium]